MCYNIAVIFPRLLFASGSKGRSFPKAKGGPFPWQKVDRSGHEKRCRVSLRMLKMVSTCRYFSIFLFVFEWLKTANHFHQVAPLNVEEFSAKMSLPFCACHCLRFKFCCSALRWTCSSTSPHLRDPSSQSSNKSFFDLRYIGAKVDGNALLDAERTNASHSFFIVTPQNGWRCLE